MDKPRFKPEDFKELRPWTDAEELAVICNEWLDNHLGPQVYGDTNKGLGWDKEWSHSDTHTAYLFGIQEIEKPKECEHALDLGSIETWSHTGTTAVCVRCGKKLVAKWEVAE